MKELAIDEVGEIDGKRVKCVPRIDEEDPCRKCIAKGNEDLCKTIQCLPTERDDGLDVVIEEVPTNAK